MKELLIASALSLAALGAQAKDIVDTAVGAGKIKTVQGGEITVATAGGVMVDGAKLSATDIVADNGVIHVIDSVILPK